MAQVHLPLGYPEISGQQFANVIYQGTIVRLYQVPTDPRTSAQLWERKMFSDMARMRATIGPWVRGAMLLVLGSRWVTVLLQVIKAKLNPWWDDAVSNWESFGALNKETWRNLAPYQATFNDPGMVFYALQRTVYEALKFYSGLEWEGSAFEENQAQAAYDWWIGELGNIIRYVNSTYVWNEQSAIYNYSGNWQDVNNNGAIGLVYKVLQDLNTGSVQFYYYGKGCFIYYLRQTELGKANIYLDGKFLVEIDQYLLNVGYPGSYPIWSDIKSIHHVKIEHAEDGKISFDGVRIYNTP